MMDEVKCQRHWIIPCDIMKYDIDGSLEENDDLVDWSTHGRKFQVGDVVYLYCGRPVSGIRYKMVVTRVGISGEDVIDDRGFWKIPVNLSDDLGAEFVRLKKVGFSMSDGLGLKELLLRGLKAAPRNSYVLRDGGLVRYIESLFEGDGVLDDDGGDFQKRVNDGIVVDFSNFSGGADLDLSVSDGSKGKVINKKVRVSKCALARDGYKCAMDNEHATFVTAVGNAYMEGHHLIPCTVKNSEELMTRFGKNIDCVENVVSLCPNCHRAIHFGKWEDRVEMISRLYDKQREELEKVGIIVGVDEVVERNIR